MHHHHPPTMVNNVAATINTTTTTATTSTTNQQQRRRKKRPNYGTRTVEVRRGYKGFGFTISGQQPCRLSCIVQRSPADEAGLRAGDFLISVNGLNVSKLPHETVVQLIGNSFGSIRMQIAENYYSDSSDEENAQLFLQQQQQQQSVAGALPGLGTTTRAGGSFAAIGICSAAGNRTTRPRYLHHKTKMHRLRNSPQKKRTEMTNNAFAMAESTKPMAKSAELRPLIEDLPLAAASFQSNPCKPTHQPPLSSSTVANVSAMVRVPSDALEYRTIVGYLGTIEMPKQISHSSKLQTVRSCIRKLRQEKRQPTTVLMTILPDSLRLQSANGNVLASYASERLNYVSSSSESENRFFGLVTSAVHTSQADDDDDDNGDDDDDNDDDAEERGEHNNGNDGIADELADQPMSAAASSCAGHISISNSCHVFVVDTKLCEHQAHMARAVEFRIECTKDPISNLCLEFPNNSEYVVNLIRSMYTMRILPPATKYATHDAHDVGGGGGGGMAGGGGAAAHSPQPSNHSEMSTTTSNSDSGIGFHNDCSNISDRILVVDFPGLPELRTRPPPPTVARPLGIFNHIDGAAAAAIVEKRLTVRAMPDPKQLVPIMHQSPTTTTAMHSRPNLLANFNLIKSPATSLTATRSCDDVLTLIERNAPMYDDEPAQQLLTHASMDDISLHSAATTVMLTADNDDEQQFHQFLHPSVCFSTHPALANNRPKAMDTYDLLQEYRTGGARSRHSLQSAVPSKLSPQVFDHKHRDYEAKTNCHEQKPTTSSAAVTPAFKSRHTLAFDAMTVRATALQSPLHSSAKKQDPTETWSSLQELPTLAVASNEAKQKTYSDNMLDVSSAAGREAESNSNVVISNASPSRHNFGNLSFSRPRTDKRQFASSLLSRSASMSVSDNDVYKRRQLDAATAAAATTTTTTTTTSTRSNFEGKQNHQFIMPTKFATDKKDGINNATSNNNNNNSNSVRTASKLPQPKIIKPIESKCPTNVSGVASWSTAFENLLDSAEGLQIFAEFLKKEFSAENIYFWTACERYRFIESASERIEEAMNIFNRYVSDRAMEPVNVDSCARNLTQQNLSSGDVELFSVAQKQIFKLMKFDSYQRFIRSDLYKSCLEADEKNRPLPYASESIDDLLKINFHLCASSKLKKSASNAEDRRRKSLLPWHRKSRSKSRDGSGTNVAGGGDTEQKPTKLPQLASNMLQVPSNGGGGGGGGGVHNSNTDVHSSRSSLSSFDAFPGVLTTTCNGEAEVTTYPCRFRLNDNSTTMLLPNDGESIDQLVKRLLERRRLKYSAYNLIDALTMKTIETHKCAQTLAGKEVLLEQRVAFKLYLPDPKVISVKSKPMKPLHEVVRSILERYNYAMDAVTVLRRETQTPLDLSLPVTVADGQHLEIVLNKPTAMVQQLQQQQQQADNAAKCAKANAQISPTEITNKVFTELLQKKEELADASNHDTRRPSSQTYDLCSIKSEDCGSESSSVFDRTRKRDANNMPYVKKTKLKSCSSMPDEHKFGIFLPVEDIKKPIIAKLKAGVKLQNTERVPEHKEELFEGLKRAQQARLEDQRGTEINSELPDFLHNVDLSAAASTLRKFRNKTTPISKTTTTTSNCPDESSSRPSFPQPAPRLSITNKTKNNANNDENIENATQQQQADAEAACCTTLMATAIVVSNSTNISEPNSSNSSMDSDYMGTSSSDCKGPPPLPPKPKVLPIKPSNWSTFGMPVHTRRTTSTSSSTSMNMNIAAVEPSSSFV